MRFMLLCHDDEGHWEQAGEAVLRDAMQEAVRLTHQLQERGQYLLAAPLHPAPSAKVVRVRNGKPLVTDGPYAETREVVGGFYLIDVPDVETAIRIAQQHPGARAGSVEIRRVLDLDGLPPEGFGAADAR
jgi:hypothetical protein